MRRILASCSECTGKSVTGMERDWRDFSFRQLLISLKTGNPSRVVTFFQWIFPTFSPYSGDFTSDLVDFGAPLAPPFPHEWKLPGGPYHGLQPQVQRHARGRVVPREADARTVA